MTPDEIRAEAIDRIAAADYMHWVSCRAGESTWADCTAELRDLLIAKETLAGGFQVGLDTIDNYPPSYTVRRYVGDWRKVTG